MFSHTADVYADSSVMLKIYFRARSLVSLISDTNTRMRNAPSWRNHDVESIKTKENTFKIIIKTYVTGTV